jgi:hypothetical protein
MEQKTTYFPAHFVSQEKNDFFFNSNPDLALVQWGTPEVKHYFEFF